MKKLLELKDMTFEDKYRSELYGDSFIPYAKKRVLKLAPQTKTDIQGAVGELAGHLPGKSYNVPYVATSEFYRDPNFHQFYRLKTDIEGTELNVRFRTKSDNPKEDRILDNLQEALLLRECTIADSLNEKWGNYLERIYRSLIQNPNLLRNSQESKNMTRKAQREYAKLKSAVLIDTLVEQERLGLSARDVLHFIDQSRIYPIKRERKDPFIGLLIASL